MKKQGLVKGVVRDISKVIGSGSSGEIPTEGLRTKAGGFILAKSGLRIKIK